MKCASIITSLIISSYDPGARFIDAPSGCCDRFIEMVYLRRGFMGRALFKDLTNPRSGFLFYMRRSFLPEDTADNSQSSVAPTNSDLPSHRYALQDMDKFSLKDSGRGDSEAGDSDCDMGRESPVDRLLLGEGFSDLIHLEMHHRLHPGGFQSSFFSPPAAPFFKMAAFDRGQSGAGPHL